MLEFPALIVIGMIAGLASGLIGIGGGLVVVPGLLIYYKYIGIPDEVIYQLSFGTSMFIMIFTSISAVHKHHTNGNVIWRASWIMGIASISGGFAGGLAASYVTGELLRYLFAFILMYASYRILKPIKKDGRNEPVYNPAYLIPAGIIVGFLGAALGIGGGTFSMPVMILFFYYPVKKVAGTSAGIIIFTAIAATAGYIAGGWQNPALTGKSFGFVDYSTGLPIMMGSVVFARIGAYVNTKISGTLLRRIFGCYLFGMFIKILFF